MKKSYFKWGAISRRQAKVMTWWRKGSRYANYNGIIADGAIRSGKTVCMAFSFALWAMDSYDRYNFALCGKTIASLRRNVLGTLKNQLRARGYTATERRADNLLVVTKGNRANMFYIFGGKDESSQDLIQGITLAGVLFDEVALMPESFVNQATARCSVTGSKFWFNCNPGSVTHWFYLEWVLKCRRRKILYLHFTMADNLTLNDDVRKRYESQWSGVFHKRYILGLWCVAEGLIYQQFAEDEQRYMIPQKDVPKLSYIEIGADVGGNKSNHAYVASGYTADRDVMYVLKSWSYKATGTTVTQYRENLMKFADSIKEQYGFVDTIWPDCAEAAIVNELDAHSNYRIRGSIKGEIIDRVRCADILFSQDRIKIVDGECEDLCAGLRTAVWDEKHDDQPLDDGTYDRDIIDAFDYSMTPHITRLVRG